jgi:hypothetical protein
MTRRAAITFLAGLLLLWQAAFAQPKLYAVNSKAQGAPFDLVVTEIKREPNKSFISVPGFHNRTAPGSRWLMCAYTDMALKRGFSHWVVVYPPADSETLVVGFSNSASTPIPALLGTDYNKERVMGETLMPVEKLFAMCGMRR